MDKVTQSFHNLSLAGDKWTYMGEGKTILTEVRWTQCHRKVSVKKVRLGLLDGPIPRTLRLHHVTLPPTFWLDHALWCGFCERIEVEKCVLEQAWDGQFAPEVLSQSFPQIRWMEGNQWVVSRLFPTPVFLPPNHISPTNTS